MNHQLNFAFYILIFAFINAGCEQLTTPAELPAPTGNDLNRLAVYAPYAPAKVDIMPLTELISNGDTGQAKISLYVSLLDTFGSQIKSPCVFRFELYERIQRSAAPKGGRIILWADIDLTDPARNDEHWRDFLRAYEFDLPFEPTANQSYILQVTCLCPTDKRLSAEFTLKQTQ